MRHYQILNLMLSYLMYILSGIACYRMYRLSYVCVIAFCISYRISNLVEPYPMYIRSYPVLHKQGDKSRMLILPIYKTLL